MAGRYAHSLRSLVNGAQLQNQPVQSAVLQLLGQFVFLDVAFALQRIQLRVESGSNHRHQIGDATQRRRCGLQQVAVRIMRVYCHGFIGVRFANCVRYSLQQIAKIAGIVTRHIVDVRLDDVLVHRMQRTARERQYQFAQRRQILLLVLLRGAGGRFEALHDVGDADEAEPDAFRGDDDFRRIERSAGETGLMDGPQTGRQLHDNAPDFRFGQERTVLRSLHIAFVAADSMCKTKGYRENTISLIAFPCRPKLPEGTRLAMEWIGIAVDIVGGGEILGKHRLRSWMVVVDKDQC